MTTADLLEFRRQKDDFFRDSHQSPLGHGPRDDFEGLAYFPPNESLVFTVEVSEGDMSEIRIPTSDDAEKVYRRAATAQLEIDGEPVTLTLFDTGHPGLFLPFRDATSGETTYGAGRYLDLHPNDDGTVTIDFNYAYNPSCVYSEGFSCPIPPIENWLKMPIEAGEKNYPGA